MLQETSTDLLSLELVKAVREANNATALELIASGADINYFGSIMLSADSTGPVVQCYLLDLIVYLDNFELFRKIGAKKFDLSIYNVTAAPTQNILNKRVNTMDYSVTQRFPNYFARQAAKSKFAHELTVRLLWCSIFCNWLCQHKQIKILEDLQRLTNNTRNTFAMQFRSQVLSIYAKERIYEFFCGTPYSTLKLTSLYLQAVKEPTTVTHLQQQYWLDKYLNAKLSLHGYHLHLARGLDIDCIFPINKENPDTKPVYDLLHYYNAQIYTFSAVMLHMLPFAAFGFWFAFHNLAANDINFENVALLALSSLFFAYAAAQMLQLLFTLSCRALSCGRLEILGSMDTIAVRMYTTHMLHSYLQKPKVIDTDPDFVIDDAEAQLYLAPPRSSQTVEI